MTTSVLTTKILIPPPRPRERMVPRPRLLQKLDEGLRLGHRLILVSAPAGCGKSELLSEWIESVQALKHGDVPAFGWVSIDAGDNDLIRFLSYLIAALQTIDASVGQSAVTLLQAPKGTDRAYPIEAVLTSLINDLVLRRGALVVVLDDYHLVVAQSIHDALLFLLDHLPPHVHLVIASRVDPPFPLSRLRSRDQLTELRDTDLRFTPGETTVFLNQVMGLGLSADDVAALEARTEGWIAGLQLAALSMQGCADVSGFISAFTGSNRYILDYLVEEVLRAQPEDVQRFLLKTSILDRMTGSLCDALTGRGDGQIVLEMLEQANLFIVPLDQDRIWYRYHHLFAEFLRGHLRAVLRLDTSRADGIEEEMSDLHCRASVWYEGHGLLVEAVAHALEAQDFERAANLIEQTTREVLMRGEASTLLNWLQALPDPVVRSRPHLCLAYAWARVMGGQLDIAERHVHEAIQAASMGQVGILGEAAAIRTLTAVLQGNLHDAIELAREALEHLPTEDIFLRSMIALNLGLAYDMLGEVPAATQAYGEAWAISQAAGNTLMSLLAITQLADLKVLEGKLHEAADIYQQAIRLAAKLGKQLPFEGMAYTGMGRLLYEWNDLDGATRHLITSVERGQRWESTDLLVAGSVYLAQVRQAQGDLEGAQNLIQQAEQALQGDIVSSSTVGEAQAYQARLWVRQGNLEAAGRWVQAYQARTRDVSGYLRHIEGASCARVLMAQGEPDAVIGLIGPLLQVAEAAGQISNVIELLALRALALEARGQSATAMGALRRALTLAEPEGYVRTFVDEGEPMAILLRRAASHGITPTYVSKLLTAFEVSAYERMGDTLPHPRPQPLTESLSPRELEVLRLLATGLSNKEIAQTLIIAVGTVKQHLKSVYGKLDVHNRTEATNRARELGLL